MLRRKRRALFFRDRRLQTEGSVSPGSDEYEDLSTYTEVDEHSQITITTTKFTATNYQYDHAESYVYKDFGAGYFGTNVEIQFELNVTSFNKFDSGLWGPAVICLTNTLGDIYDIAGGPVVRINPDSTDYTANVEIGAGHDDYAAVTHSHVPAPATTYYCTFVTTYAVDNKSNVRLSIYTDSGRTTLLKTVLLTMF